MLTGKIPFEGDTAFAVGLKHKSEEPENPSRLNSNIPEDLSLLVLKCLEKDKENRFQGANELRSELTKIENGIPTSKKDAPKGKHITSREITVQLNLKKLFIPLTVFVAIVSVIILAILLINKIPSGNSITPIYKQLTFTGTASLPVISPDGNFIAYINQETFNEHAIIIQDIISGHASEIYRVNQYFNLHWMPDSSEICISGQGLDSKWEIFAIPRLGGMPRKIPYIPFFTISPDGSQLAGAYASTEFVAFLDKMTGESRTIPLSKDFIWFHDLDWSSLGDFILFFTLDNEKNTIWTIKTDGSNQQKVVEEQVPLFSPRWSQDGDKILYLRGKGQERELWSIPISPDTGKSLKPSSLVIPAFQAGDSFSLDKDDKRFVYTRTLEYSNFWLATSGSSRESSGFVKKAITTGTLMNSWPSISPDGRQIVFSSGDGIKANIYVMPIEGGSPTQITFMDSYNVSPAWSPDGKHIAFACLEGGAFKVWKVSLQGGIPFQFTESEISQDAPFVVWAPGSDILYMRPGNRNFHFLNPDTEEETPLVQDDSIGWMFLPKYSPDGKRVVVRWSRGDESGLWIISLDDSSSYCIKKGPFSPIGWSVDGKWVYSFESSGGTVRIFLIDIKSLQERPVTQIPFSLEIGHPSPFGKDIICMSPDGKNFIIPVYKTNSDVWMIENFDEIRK